jgi:hypothetical protein
MGRNLSGGEEKFEVGDTGVVRVTFKVLEVLDRYSGDVDVVDAMLGVLKKITEQQT